MYHLLRPILLKVFIILQLVQQRSVDAAVNQGVETFVLISTDKAVRPTNVMGASKRMAELYCQGLSCDEIQKRKSVLYVLVMYWVHQVLSYLCLKSRLQKVGLLTVTHPEVTRYFMTIPEAAQLVIQAGAMGTGGDVFYWIWVSLLKL